MRAGTTHGARKGYCSEVLVRLNNRSRCIDRGKYTREMPWRGSEEEDKLEGQILAVWRKTLMRLRRLTECNEDMDKQTEGRRGLQELEVRKKQRARQRYNSGQQRTVLLRTQRGTSKS